MSDPPAHCPICQTPFPEGRLEGLCPACFLSAADELPSQELVRGREIARGGMGIVFEAEQQEPRRTVAMKMLLPRWCEDAEVRERFRREAAAMASLEHPAILPVYEVGETDGLPWFTMKLAARGSLATRIAEQRGEWQRIARLVARLAGALAFAHERGVLHRDVKPGNILFDDEDACYLADFGLAKDLSMAEAGLTMEAQMLGTPHFLAPELASGAARTATTASDIYSLGAVLYELLSGHPPHQDDHLPALLRRVADERPASLSQCLPCPPRDLIAVCEKAMAREPEHRYATARELAQDLTRFVRSEPVLARQAGKVEALWRWCARHPAVAALLALVMALLVFIAAGSMVAVVRITHEEQKAIAARDEAEASSRRSKLAAAEGLRRARQPRFRDHALDRVMEAGAPDEDNEMRVNRRAEAMAIFAYPELHEHSLPITDAGWSLAVVSSGHEFYAWRGKEGWRVTRGRDGAVTSQSPTQGSPHLLSRDGRWLAVMLAEGWQLWDVSKPEARLHDTLPGYPEDLSDDGQLVAFYHQQRVGDGMVFAEVRETFNNTTRFKLTFPQVSVKIRFNADASLCAVAPSSYLNDSDFPYTVRLHRSHDGSVERELSAGMKNCIWSMAWSRDGSLLAAGERGGATLIWNTLTGNPRHLLRGAGTDMWLLAFSEDGRFLSSISSDRLLSVFDVMSGLPVARGHEWVPVGVPRMFWSAAEPSVFGPISIDGRNTFVRVDLGAFDSFTTPDSHGSVQGIAVSPDKRWLVVGDSRHARVWSTAGKREWRLLAKGLWNDFTFSADGRWLYGSGEPGVAQWQVNEQGVIESSRQDLIVGGSHHSLALSALGDVLATDAGHRSVVHVIRRPAAEMQVSDLKHQRHASSLSLTRDGKLLAAASAGGVSVWRTETGEVLHQQKQPALWATFSPDGTWLVLGRGRYEVWRTSDWSRVHTLDMRSIDPVQARADFTPDGRSLATAHAFGRIGLWSVTDWKRYALIESPNSQPVGRFCFTPDQTRLYIASSSGVVETWDLRQLEDELKNIGLAW